VRERSGLTFGAALRSIMRQDPDVILIGEIRDRETAEIAIQASLTGHLVFSTLHTNDAASAVTRLLDIGVAAHKLATALKGVLAQRLVRRVCTVCRGATRDAGSVRGCRVCGGTGFHGRVAIVEILRVDGEVERLVASASPAEPVAAAARRAGMRSLWESGIARVHAGDTTMEELLRVAEPPWEAVAGSFGSPESGVAAHAAIDDAEARAADTPPPAADATRAASTRRTGAARATFLALRLRRVAAPRMEARSLPMDAAADGARPPPSPSR
jgi:hypothetical protein